jgi:hypothetical protein
MNPAAPAQAPGADDAGCRARHRSGGSAPRGHGRRPTTSPGTWRGRYGPNPWRALALGAWTGVTSTRRSQRTRCRGCGRTSRRGRGAGSAPAVPAPPVPAAGCGPAGDPGAIGLAVTAARWTRRVSSSRKNSTYSRRNQTVSTVKQVTGEDPGGLAAQERPPCRARPPRSRIKPVATQGRADRGGRDPHAQPQQQRHDAHAPILPQAGWSRQV